MDSFLTEAERREVKQSSPRPQVQISFGSWKFLNELLHSASSRLGE